jgi:hypothetical protein
LFPHQSWNLERFKRLQCLDDSRVVAIADNHFRQKLVLL